MSQATPAARVTATALLALATVLTPPAVAAAPAPAPAIGAPAPAIGARAPAAAAPPSAPPPSAPAAAAADHSRANKVLVRRYLTEVLAAGKLDKLEEIVAGSFIDRSPSAGGSNLRGPDAARQAQKRFRELFSKVEYSPQALIAEGDQVAARYVMLATLKPERGAPAPPPLLLNGIAVFRVRAGRIQEVFTLNDQMGLLRQLGYTLVPPGGSAAAPAPAAPPATHPPASNPPAPNPPPSNPRASNAPPSSPPPPTPPPARR
jgi:predicted ester cyclase